MSHGLGGQSVLFEWPLINKYSRYDGNDKMLLFFPRVTIFAKPKRITQKNYKWEPQAHGILNLKKQLIGNILCGNRHQTNFNFPAEHLKIFVYVSVQQIIKGTNLDKYLTCAIYHWFICIFVYFPKYKAIVAGLHPTSVHCKFCSSVSL